MLPVWLPVRVADSDLLKIRDDFRQLQGLDVQDRDFSQVSLASLYATTFDTRTTWPTNAKLPTGFDPAVVLELGRDPGLGVRSLHRRGITGKGISVAVIDKPILTSHQEFADRLTYVEVFPDHPKNGMMHMHGATAAGLLAGKTVGVVPESHLYYFAVPDNGKNVGNYAAALEQILLLNTELPRGQRIRVVSISDGFDAQATDRPDVKALIDVMDRADEQGVAVVHNGTNFALDIAVTGAPPGRDRDKVESYEPWLRFTRLWPERAQPDWLVAPGDYRTSASIKGPAEYAYWGEGGVSWAIPYVAGVVALGVQVRSDMPVSELYRVLEETSIRSSKGFRLINPTGFIQRIQSQ
jgi:hypothetical protein